MHLRKLDTRYSDNDNPHSLLSYFVPLNVLSGEHLKTVDRYVKEDIFVSGQTVADGEAISKNHYFIVSGTVTVVGIRDMHKRIEAGCKESHVSLVELVPAVQSIVAEEDSKILVVDRELLDSMLCWDQAAKYLALEVSGEREMDEDATWINTLLASSLFHKVPPYNIKAIFNQFEPMVVQSGDVIIRQGEEGDTCYVIKEGSAKVLQSYPGESAPREVARLHAGRCFGEDALLNHTVRNATVVMETNGVIMALKKHDFFSLLREPEVTPIPYRKAEDYIVSGAQWLDVRSQEEFENYHLPEAFHLPIHLMSLKSRLMSKEQLYVAYCSTGQRAATATYLLRQMGFNVVALAPDASERWQLAANL